MRLSEILTDEETIELADLLARPVPRIAGKLVVPVETDDSRLERLAGMYGQQDEADRREQAEMAAIELDLAKAEATRAKAALDRAKASDIIGGE